MEGSNVFIRTRDGRWSFVRMAPDGDAGAGDGGGSDGDGNGAGKTFTQAELDTIVRDRLTRERGKFQDYDSLKAAAQELQQLKAASQSDIERITTERDTLKGQLNSLTAETTRQKVALKKGLVGDKAVLAGRLSGTTEAEMEADADELLKLFGGTGGSGFDGGARGGGDKPQSMDDLIRGARR
jgi:hypothetical protein